MTNFILKMFYLQNHICVDTFEMMQYPGEGNHQSLVVLSQQFKTSIHTSCFPFTLSFSRYRSLPYIENNPKPRINGGGTYDTCFSIAKTYFLLKVQS
jgi:hypothetical protein